MQVHDHTVFLDRPKPERKSVKESTVPKGRYLKAGELCLFAQTLSGLLDGGVPILKALDGLERSAESSELKKTLVDVQENIRRGVGFAQALEKCGRTPAYFHQTAYAGEVSGQVPAILSELSKYMEKEETLKRNVRDALVYPAFIVCVGFITISILLCFVLPKLRGIYDGYGAKLPVITMLVLGLSRVFLPLTLMTVTGASTLVLSLKKKGDLSLIFYKAPVIGDYFKRFVRVRFSRLLSLLLQSGVPVLEAIEVVEKTFDDAFLRHDIRTVKKSLAAGRGFSECMEKVEWMDPLSRMIVTSGEETGRLSESFFKIARDTENALEAKIQLVVKLLEPGLILAIGLAVGIVVIGTVLPIFDMSSVVQ